MNVHGVGGAASLPMTLASSSRVVAPAAGAAGSSVSGVTSGQGEGALPGQSRTSAAHETATKHKETPKPTPLPPLRGLTVAEIRAMLGVATLPGQTETAAATTSTGGTTSIISAALKNHT